MRLEERIREKMNERRRKRLQRATLISNSFHRRENVDFVVLNRGMGLKKQYMRDSNEIWFPNSVWVLLYRGRLPSLFLLFSKSTQFDPDGYSWCVFFKFERLHLWRQEITTWKFLDFVFILISLVLSPKNLSWHGKKKVESYFLRRGFLLQANPVYWSCPRSIMSWARRVFS